jgi:hypothetical protein
VRYDNPEERAKRLPADAKRLYESFKAAGMGPGAALAAVAGRGRLPSTDPAEERREAFEESGMSPRGAEAAATGQYGDTGAGVADGGRSKSEAEAKAARKRREAEAKAKREREEESKSEAIADLHRDRSQAEFAESLTREELQAIRQSEFYRQRTDHYMESMPISEALRQAEMDTIARVNEMLDRRNAGRA